MQPCASREHGILEDDAVVAVRAGALRRLAVDGHRAGGRLHEVADHTQQRRLAAAGGADQVDELARHELEVDVLQRGDVAARERLRHAFDAHDGRDCAHATFSGARRTMIFSATTTIEKRMPRTAETMFVAQSSCGSSE